MNRIIRFAIFVAFIVSLTSARVEKRPALNIAGHDVDRPSLNLKKITDHLYAIMGAGANITFGSCAGLDHLLIKS